VRNVAIDRVFERRVAALVNCREPRLLLGGRRGLEREALRVDAAGHIARTPHPRALGSSLTNPHITTDFSEALLEVVTPTFDDNGRLLQYLDDLHDFIYRNLGDELLWATSMPCELSGEADVPLARFGSSFAGQVKHIYRRGLRTRYGGMMQAISGVHFNYSFPQQFWEAYAEICAERDSDADFISARYFDVLRNYRRHGWIVSYLFGVSPALCRSFMQGRSDPDLKPLGDDTLIGPFATSLRMSDIGYRNRSEHEAEVSVNSLEEYLRDLRRAVATPHAPFAALGLRVDGEYQQLSTNLLQIENEYYSYIRPKRVPRAGERTTQALARAGVEYVEVRALDNSAFDPAGVNLRKLCFLEALLVLLLTKDSPPIGASEEEALDRNHLLVARRGREPGLKLERDGRSVTLASWGAELLDSLRGICELLDAGHVERPYTRSLTEQLGKLEDVQRTPSARLLHEMQLNDEGFAALALRMSREHAQFFRQYPSSNVALLQEFAAEAESSLQEQEQMEARDRGSFEDYLARYLTE
jgi:glutamate--cysteine ligase